MATNLAPGAATLPLSLPQDPNLIGATLEVQWLAIDPGNALGVSTSNAAEVRIGG